VRYCVFSTGPFVEPITVWEPGRRLGFDVAQQPPPMHHDNGVYEDDWGERYEGLLAGTAAGDNYAEEANQTHAKNLKGKLFLVHGMMDDNVPPTNTELVVDALIKAGKDFDLLMLPHARHGYGADNNYVMRRRWDYFVKNLLGAEPPTGYQIGKPAVSP
jgi:hypothetical protein